MTRHSVSAFAFAFGVLVAPLFVIPTAAADRVTSCPQNRPDRDLNGDGYVDTVVGDPYATVEKQAEAGTVTVLFGGADGRIGEGERRLLTQRDLGETPEAGDHFGWSVSIYYRVDRADGVACSGLMIGAPGEDVDGQEDAGVAHVLLMNSGSQDEPERDVALTVDQSEVGDTVEAGDEFGYSVAASYSRDDLTLYPIFTFGAPGENDDAGVVNVWGGGQLRQGTGGLPGRMQAGDRFGEVIGSLHYVPEDEPNSPLYIGSPGDVVDGKRGAGSVTVVDAIGSPRLISQNTRGVPGAAEAGDHFGASMASGRGAFNQLAIGAPGEDVGSVMDAGSVTVLKRTDETIYPGVVLTQATKGVAGTVETGDQFGAAVAYRDDRTLAIGVPGEDLGSVVDAGSVQIVRVGKTRLSFPLPTITENSPGTAGVVQADSRFGTTVTGVPRGDGEAIFAISSPFQDGGSVYVISSDPTINPRSWKPGSGGIPGPGARFGQSVA
jgi:hypothetical protein